LGIDKVCIRSLFFSPSPNLNLKFEFLWQAKDHLPLLERLTVGGTERMAGEVDISGTAPKLTRAAFHRMPTALFSVPRNQLHEIVYIGNCIDGTIPDGLADIRHCYNRFEVRIAQEISKFSLPCPFSPIHSNLFHLVTR
jgi:hypothetical protein